MGPLDDADDAMDDDGDDIAALEVDIDVDDGEIEVAMTQMPQTAGGGRGVDISAFIAHKTQRERTGSRDSQRPVGSGKPSTALPSRGEPHQLSYYGLSDAICNVRNSCFISFACAFSHSLAPFNAQVYAAKGMTRLYEWQMEALAQPGVLDGGSLVYSAPTSAGKSLVADVLLLRALQRSPRRGVLVVLPYNALCDEKAAGLERLAKPLNVPVHRHYSDRSGPLPSGDLGIIVCTFEKANAIVARLIEADRLCAIGCVVVDELHMLSGTLVSQPHACTPLLTALFSVADEGRGPTLESLCSTLLYYSFIDAGKEGDPTHPSPALSSQQLRLRNANLPANECRRASLPRIGARGRRADACSLRIQMIGMSATLPNFSVLGTWWRAATYVTGYRPTPLEHRFVVRRLAFVAPAASAKTFAPAARQCDAGQRRPGGSHAGGCAELEGRQRWRDGAAGAGDD
jgi:DNA polymerase theta